MTQAALTHVPPHGSLTGLVNNSKAQHEARDMGGV